MPQKVEMEIRSPKRILIDLFLLKKTMLRPKTDIPQMAIKIIRLT
ncbi:MAG: hypothetical protein ACJAT2_000531 [Bacteriovoracaceae bacterium]|jgi:hypothetical protein